LLQISDRVIKIHWIFVFLYKNKNMTSYQVGEDEHQRLESLRFHELVNVSKDPELDIFAEAACLITNCPVAIIGVMEADQQRIQSCVGMDVDFVPRQETVCQYTI